jgi:ElaA protein
MAFEFKHFNDLTNYELYEILQLRSEIFVVEQNCVYNDLDGLDNEAIHLFLRLNGEIIAYSRLLRPGTRFPDCSIGRVVVKQSERGKSIGIEMMNAAKHYILNEWGATRIKVSAQQYLQRFYENLGFEIVTDMYLEDGIPHFGMLFQIEQ